MTDRPEPIFFPDAAALREWLERNSATAPELLVGFHKVGTGNAELRWADAVDEALCVGWIDGVRRRIDDDRYVIRFTPRKPRSTWSAVNIRRAGELIAAGRMRPAGLAAFGETRPIHIVSRKASASPSTGSTKKHALEQAELMARAFDR